MKFLHQLIINNTKIEENIMCRNKLDWTSQ